MPMMSQSVQGFATFDLISLAIMPMSSWFAGCGSPVPAGIVHGPYSTVLVVIAAPADAANAKTANSAHASAAARYLVRGMYFPLGCGAAQAFPDPQRPNARDPS